MASLQPWQEQGTIDIGSVERTEVVVFEEK